MREQGNPLLVKKEMCPHDPNLSKYDCCACALEEAERRIDAMREQGKGKFDPNADYIVPSAPKGKGKWTEGPLHIYRCFQNNGPDYWIVSPKAFHGTEVGRFAREEDAVLFAAAPEMVEVLSWVSENLLNIRQHPEMYPNLEAKAVRLRAILAKVEGVKP